MGNEKPTHDPDSCVWKYGHWECLHAIDADHFWYGDVMVDILSLNHEALRVLDGRRAQADNGKRSHALGFNLTYLYHVAMCLVKPSKGLRWIKIEQVWKALKKLNELGLHTGVRGGA